MMSTAKKTLALEAKDHQHRPGTLLDEEDVISLQYKIILLGDGAVGKTSIATRFAEDQFNQKYKQTVGVDFFIRRLVVTHDPVGGL